MRGYGGTDCSCILLVTSVISLTTGVDLTSDTWGLAKLCPGGSDCRLTSSTVGFDFLPATRGAFAGFAVNTKAACGPRCPTQSTTVLGGTGCTGPAFLFFVGGGCAIGEPNFWVTTLPNEPEIRLMGLSDCVDPSVRSVRLRGGVKYRLPIPNNFGMGTRAAIVTDGPAKVFPVECGGWLSWLVDVMERKTELTTTEVGGGAVDV